MTTCSARRIRRRAVAVTAAATGTLGLLTACAGGASANSTSSPRASVSWVHAIASQVSLSSPVPATIDGVPAVVVGDLGGHVHAYSLRSGAELPGWPVTVPGAAPVVSTPSVDGSTIFVGTGSPAKPAGGYLALWSNGTRRWYRQLHQTPTGGPYDGVAASMAVGALQGIPSVVAGSMGQLMDSFGVGGTTHKGFPWLSTDSEFSTPSIADVYDNGHDEIVSGATQTAGFTANHRYTQGGHLRILAETGNAGTGTPIGGVRCDKTPDEVVNSSPAVGRFLPPPTGSAVRSIGIVVGTGVEMAGKVWEDRIFAVNPNGCRSSWNDLLDGGTQSSPALVDAWGNGQLQIAEGTMHDSKGAGGSVYLIAGPNGKVLWRTHLGPSVIGSITSAGLVPGYQDLLVPTTSGLYVLDGRTGHVLSFTLPGGQVVNHLAVDGIGLQNSPLVTDDANGTLGITVAGYNGTGHGAIAHYELARPAGVSADQTGAWPMFHHDPQLSGTTLPRLARG